MFRSFLSWSKGFLSENGEASSKRLVGVVCGGFLCWSLYSKTNANPVLVESVALLAFGCLGLTSAEKIFKKMENSITKKTKR